MLWLAITSMTAWSTIHYESDSELVLASNSNYEIKSGLRKPTGIANKTAYGKTSKSLQRVSNSQRFNEFKSNTSCSLQEAIGISNEELASYLIELDSSCTSEFFYGDETLLSEFFTAERIVLLANEIQSRSEGYQLEAAAVLERLLMIIRAGYFNQGYDESNLYDWDEFTPEVRSATLSALNEFYSTNIFWTTGDDMHASAVWEWFHLIDGAEAHVEFIPMFKQLLSRFNEDFIEAHWWAAVYNDLFYQHIDRGLGRQAFIDAIAEDSEFLELLETATSRRWLLTIEDGYYDYLIFNTYFYLVKVHGFNLFPERLEQVLSQLLNEEERFSYLWMALVRSINGWNDCNLFAEHNICEDIVKPELEAMLFPNTFAFDDGKMVVRTGLELAKVEPLYYAAKQVQAQFFRLTENDQPLPDDLNETLTMVIYDSPESYDLYQYFLNGIDTDNGGIYIEQRGTFYTYDRTEQDSIYSLEELFRHEFTHYLQARFSIHGIFGETEFYENNRITWLNEGSAEYLAHSTQFDGVQQRHTIVRRIANDSERLTIQTIVSSGYSDGFKFYRYASLLVDFLNENYNSTLTDIFNAIRNNDIESFDALIASISNDSDLESEYQAYIDQAIQNLDNLTNPSTFFLPSRFLERDTVLDVEQTLITHTPLLDAECEEFAVTIERRVICRGVLRNTTDNAKEYFTQTLDYSLQELVELSGDFDWYNIVCWHGELMDNGSEIQTNYTCETSIRQENTERENILPVVNIPTSIYLYDEHETLIEASAVDLDSDTLTYQWEQVSGPELTFDSKSILQPTVIADESLEGEFSVELKLTVTDEHDSVSKTVSFRLYAYNSAPEVSLGEEQYVYYGDSVELLSEAYDPEGQELTYRWEYEGNLAIDFDSLTNPDLSFTIPESESNQQIVLAFTLHVSDGEREDFNVVYVYVSKKSDSTAPVLTLNGDANMTIEVGSVFTDPGATAFDNNDGDLTANIIVSGIVDPNVIGEYNLSYEVTDSSDNTTTVTRNVTVVDTTAPIVTLIGADSITIKRGATFTDPGATALDNNDGDITGSIVVTGSVNTSAVGEYLLTYRVSDSSGNTATVTRKVTVEAKKKSGGTLFYSLVFLLIAGYYRKKFS